MSFQDHPWVQDYRSFEAVLCCRSGLDGWDKAATIRAYQTYGFDDASTTDDQTFKHIETGVLLLHDGGVVAIQYGDGNLVGALADLFMVLYSLGWKEAEVYHPEETRAQVMHDMGEAIPGHLNFDVRVAPDLREGGHIAEADQLVQMGTSLMQNVASTAHEAQEFHSIALRELQSMSPDGVSQMEERSAGGESSANGYGVSAVTAAEPLILDEDLGDDPSHYQSPRLGQEASVAFPQSGQVFLDDLDAGPVIPDLGGPQLEIGASSLDGAHQVDGLSQDDVQVEPAFIAADWSAPSGGHVPAQEPVPVAFAPAPVPQEREPVVAAVVKSVPVAPAPAQVAHAMQEDDSPVLTSMSNHAAASAGAHVGAFIRVGNSALSFDLPDAPVSLDDLNKRADEIGAQEVIHVWPGLVNQAARWDLIGEIDPDAPWFAEVIAGVLEVQRPIERVWFAAALIQLAKQKEGAQLRDLLVNLNRDGETEIFNGGTLRAIAFKREDIDSFAYAVLGGFSGLLLSEPGAGFLDTKPAAGMDVHSFSVRAMIEAPEPKLYVIHLDAVDGPFVEMTTNLLMTVAHRYSISTRARTQALAMQHEAERRETIQREAAKRQAIVEVQAVTAKLLEVMQTAGLSLADLRLPA